MWQYGFQSILPAAFPQVASNETAYVLNGILGTFLQLTVLLDRFSGTKRDADLIAEVFPGNFTVLPLLVHTAIADCNFHAVTSLAVS